MWLHGRAADRHIDGGTCSNVTDVNRIGSTGEEADLVARPQGECKEGIVGTRLFAQHHHLAVCTRTESGHDDGLVG
jgi:hypothetical protein